MKIDLFTVGLFLIATLFLVFFLFMFLMIIVDPRGEAIERLGCESERFLDERVCQIGSVYYFVDVDCNDWGFDCTAQLVTVEGIVVDVK